MAYLPSAQYSPKSRSAPPAGSGKRSKAKKVSMTFDAFVSNIYLPYASVVH